MDDTGPASASEFGSTAKQLATSPLGIIGLFIVLVYGLAVIGLVFASNLDSVQSDLIVGFLVVFPCIVFGVFSWLVVNHSQKLYAPRDFKDEDNWVRMQLHAVASLTAADRASADREMSDETTVTRIVDAVQASTSTTQRGNTRLWRGRILWVDDRPDNNGFERRAFEAMGFSFILEESTETALRSIAIHNFVAVISDMGRPGDPHAGYTLLSEMRHRGLSTPFFIYAGSRDEEHRRMTLERGAQGTTDRPDELFEMVLTATQGK